MTAATSATSRPAPASATSGSSGYTASVRADQPEHRDGGGTEAEGCREHAARTAPPGQPVDPRGGQESPERQRGLQPAEPPLPARVHGQQHQRRDQVPVEEVVEHRQRHRPAYLGAADHLAQPRRELGTQTFVLGAGRCGQTHGEGQRPAGDEGQRGSERDRMRPGRQGAAGRRCRDRPASWCSPHRSRGRWPRRARRPPRTRGGRHQRGVRRRGRDCGEGRQPDEDRDRPPERSRAADARGEGGAHESRPGEHAAARDAVREHAGQRREHRVRGENRGRPRRTPRPATRWRRRGPRPRA